MLALREAFQGSVEAGNGVAFYTRDLTSVLDFNGLSAETIELSTEVEPHGAMDAFVDKISGGFTGRQPKTQDTGKPDPQQTAQQGVVVAPDLGKRLAWKPEPELNNDRIARADIGQKQDTAAAMTADAEKGLQTLTQAKAEIAKAMEAHQTGESGPQTEDAAAPTGLLGYGRGMAVQAGAVSLAGTFAGPAAAAALGGLFVASDALKAAGKGFSASVSAGQGSFGAPEESPQTATLSKEEAKEYKESGYLAQRSSSEQSNQDSQPIMTPTRDVFDRGRIETTEAGLAGICALSLEECPQMKDMHANIKRTEGELNTQYQYAVRIADNLEAREYNGIALAEGNNLNDAVNAGLEINPGMRNLPGDIA